MAKYKYEKEFLFSPHKAEQIILFLNDNPIDLLLVRDAEKNTVIHTTAFQDNMELLKIYLAYQKRSHPPSDETKMKPSQHFLSLINSQNGEGYSALLYAAYKGNIQIMDFLIRNHADLTLRSKKGLNIYHLAAQGDQIRTFMYLHNLKQPLDLYDYQGSTPLHWAAFSGSLKIVEYILTRPLKNINAQDSSFNTALHIATLYGHTNIVKLLLRYGSDKTLKNSQGLTPYHIAINNNFINLGNVLKQKRSLYETLLIYCNARQDYQPKSKSCTLPIFYVIYYTIIMVLLSITLKYNSTIIYYTQTTLFIIVYMLYISLLTSSSTPAHSTFKQLLQKGINLHDICFSCVKLRAKREYHCYICSDCINQYDHHCFWINNCVGKHNIGRFYAFILGDTILLTWIGLIGIVLILNNFTNTTILFTYSNIIQLSSAVNELYVIVSAVVLLTPFTAYILPLIFLLMVQTMNLLLNRTTYERFSHENSSVLGDDEPEIKLKHCWEMICQNKLTQESDTTSDMSKLEHRLIKQS